MNHTYARLWSRLFALAMLFVLTTGASLAQWAELPALTDQAYNAQNAIYNGKLYTFGGISSTAYLSTGRQLDILNGSKWTAAANLPETRWGGYAAEVDGKIYIIGGVLQSGNNISFLVNVMEYDPATNTLTERSQIPVPLFSGCGAVIGKKIYVMGGATVSSGQLVYNNSTQVYDVATNTWSNATAVPYNAQYPTATAVGNDIYLIGGSGATSSNMDVAYKGTVDGTTITWTPIAAHPTGVTQAAAGTLNGMVYVAGGAINGAPTDHMYKYDPASNKWAVDYSLPVPTAGVVAMQSNGTNLYFIGGIKNPGVFEYTAGPAKPIAKVTQNQLLITVKKGSTATTRLALTNNGIADMTGSFGIPQDASWLTAPASYTVAPISSSVINLTADASSLDVGIYKTTLTINTNDANNKAIPVDVRLYVVEDQIAQPSHILVEEGSGDWCGWCPEGHRVLEQIESSLGESAIALSYHGGSQTEALQIANGVQVLSKLGLQGFPNASIHRWLFPGEDYQMTDRGNWLAYVNAALAVQPVAPVAVMIDDYKFTPETNNVTATIRLVVDQAIPMPQGSSLHLTAWVKQDGIVQEQTEYTIQGNQVVTDHHPDYEQMDVVRFMYPNSDGMTITIPNDKIVEGVVLPGTEITQELSFTVSVASSSSQFDFKPENSEIVFAAHQNMGSALGQVYQSVVRPVLSGSTPGATISATTTTSSKTIEPNTTATYETTIKNLTQDPQSLQVVRTQNTLPTGWTSSFKIGSTEYPADVSQATISLPPGASIQVLVNVTGATENETGTVKMQFDANGTTLDQTYTTTTSTSVSGVNDPAVTGSSMSLSLNNPNPASTTTRFEYTLANAGNPVVEVYSMDGQKVMSIEQGRREAGAYTLDLNVSSLPNGVYVVSLNSNGRSITRQINVVH